MPYDTAWPDEFLREKAHLLSCLPPDLITRIEHFGSTAVPGLAAKPIIDILVEVTDLEATKERIVQVLESRQYEYFWRSTQGDDGPPFYAWFIKRHQATGVRTHHIHMVERQFVEHWKRLLFRDWSRRAKRFRVIMLPRHAAHSQSLSTESDQGQGPDGVADDRRRKPVSVGAGGIVVHEPALPATIST